MLRIALIGLVAVLEAPAVAQSPGTETVSIQRPSDDKTDANRIECRRQEQIGTRLGAKKVCLTVKEWQDRASADREETDRVQRDTQLGTPSG